jgi:hypothetical protein
MPASTPSSAAFSLPVSRPSSPASVESSDPTWPRTSRRPASGLSTPAIRRSTVVLPDPLAPISATPSPGAIVNPISCTPQVCVLVRRSRASAGVTARWWRSNRKRTPTPSAEIEPADIRTP